MARVNVYTDGNFVGWYDDAKTETFPEDREFDGSNHISLATNSQWDHEELIRTAGGRWVLHEWSRRDGRRPIRAFISDEKAREWLLAQGHDEAVERIFGQIEEERGPGRPGIGPIVCCRLPEPVVRRLDAFAEERKVSRAELIRRLVQENLENLP